MRMNYKEYMESAADKHEEINIKASFEQIYTQDDPREYYRVLYGLDYIIPDLARGVFRKVVDELQSLRGRPLKILDLGCSYGINAALLRLPLDLARLAQRYADLASFGLSPSELVGLDRCYFSGWPQVPMSIVGIDAAEPAVNYARTVGILDDGLAINLEESDLCAEAQRMLKDVDLVISTGCIGYVGEQTFARVMAAIEGPKPWIASFVLRMYPFEAIAEVLERHGLETQKLEGVTFVQRRFHSRRECHKVLNALEAAGVSTAGKEANGLLHAEFFLSRPSADCQAIPFERVVQVSSGEQHAFGRRYRRDADKVLRLMR